MAPTDAAQEPEMIEAAVSAVGPLRSVVLELRGGTVLGAQVAAYSIEVWQDALRWNPETLGGEQVLTVTARNTGHLRVAIDSLTLLLGADATGTETGLTMLGRNDYPHLNTELPGPLDVGASASWFASLETLRLLVGMAAAAGATPGDVWATAQLGTGESVSTARHPIGQFPL